MPQTNTSKITTVLDAVLVDLAVAVVCAVAITAASACVLTWLTLRGTRPQDRPAVVHATAQLINAFATVLSRSPATPAHHADDSGVD